jgi:hypothetical protein
MTPTLSAARAEGAKVERAKIVADLRQGADYARKTPENVFSLSIAHALEAAADRYERGEHEPKESGDG